MYCIFYASMHTSTPFPSGAAQTCPCMKGTDHQPYACETEHVHLLGCSPATFADQFEEFYQRTATLLRAFEPDLLCFSAGFDAHAEDSSTQRGSLFKGVPDEAYYRVTQAIVSVLPEHTRCISVLEGGYTKAALIGGLTAHIKALYCCDEESVIDSDSEPFGPGAAFHQDY